MKKFIIRPLSNPQWLSSYFDDTNLLSLNVCNKPLLEFYLDFLYLINCEDVLIVLPFYQSEVMAFRNRESEWGISIRVEVAVDKESYESIENRYSSFFQNDSYGIIEGAVFLDYDQRNSDFFDNLIDKKQIVLSVSESNDLPIFEIATLRAFFNLSIDVAKNRSECFNLSGFGFQNDGHIGKGVTLKNKDSISRGAHIGSCVLIDPNSILKSGAIIGDHVVVGPNVEVDTSIVFGNTVVGEGVLLKNKIVYKNKVICPLTEKYARVDQKILLPLMANSNYQQIILKMLQSIIAAIFLLYSLPTWALIRIINKLTNNNMFVHHVIISKYGEEINVYLIDRVVISKYKTISFLAEFFFASYAPLFWLAFIGEIDLIGVNSGEENITTVFKYSSLCRDPDLMPYKNVFDRFYQAKPHIISNIYALFKIIFSRIILLMR